MSLKSALRTPAGIVNGVFILLLVVAVVTGYVLLTSSDSQSAPQTAEVERGTVVSSVSATGNAAAANEWGVDFASGGRLVRVAVREGDRVRRGDLLAAVDPRDARDQVRSARATLRQAQAGVDLLVEPTSEEDLAARDSSVAQARTTVQTAEQSLSDTRMVARTTERVYDRSVQLASQSVDRSQQDVSSGRAEVDRAEARLVDAEAQEAAACAASGDPSTGQDSAACTTAQTALTTAEQEVETAAQAVETAESAVESARSTLQTARQSRATGMAQQRQTVRSAESSLESAEASYDYTVATARQAVQDASPAEIDSAQAQVDSAQVSLDSAVRALSETRLRAPANGVVSSVSASRGEYVGTSGGSTSTDTSTDSSGATTDSSTASSDAASGFVVLTAVDALQVEADFSEADATRVRVGEGASVSFEAESGQAVNGTVTSVATTSVVTDNVVTYPVTVTVQDPPKGLKVGQTATVEVVLAEAERVLFVPSSAIATNGDERTVTVYEDGEEETRSVEIGVEGDTTTEITSGVEAGEQVVTSTTGGAGGFPSGGTPGGGGLGGGL